MVRLDAQDLRRGASVIVLLAVAAIGLRSRGSLSRSAARGRDDGLPARLPGLLRGHGGTGRAGLRHGCWSWSSAAAAGGAPGQRTIRPNPLIPWWARVLGGLVAIALVDRAGGAARAGGPGAPALPPGPSAPPSRPPTLAQHGAHGAADSSAWWLAGLAAVGVAAIALALSAGCGARPPALAAFGAEPAPDRLSAAASAGAVALHSDADPRRRSSPATRRWSSSLSGAGVAARRRRHARRGAGPGLRARSLGRGRDADRPVPRWPGTATTSWPRSTARPRCRPWTRCGPTWGDIRRRAGPMSGRWAAALVAAVGLAAAGTAAYAVAGPRGLAILGTVLAIAVLLAARLAIVPAAPRRPGRRRRRRRASARKTSPRSGRSSRIWAGPGRPGGTTITSPARCSPACSAPRWKTGGSPGRRRRRGSGRTCGR